MLLETDTQPCTTKQKICKSFPHTHHESDPMIAVLKNPSYAKLFSAQIIALLGTGLLTVALGLLAFDIAGGNAGMVMGIAMSIKMIAYVVVSPVTIALVGGLPAKAVLIGADLIRAAVAVCLPFVSEAWHIYVLIFLLQAASATFTPTFQAVIPSVLPDEREYTRALSLSRLAYDLESLVSPMLAAALLTIISYHNLFIGTVVGFLASAALVSITAFPLSEAPEPAPFMNRLTRGARAFWASNELRGLLALNLVVATTTAMVIVNTVVLVQGDLGRPESDVPLLLAAYGGGSMVGTFGALGSHWRSDVHSSHAFSKASAEKQRSPQSPGSFRRALLPIARVFPSHIPTSRRPRSCHWSIGHRTGTRRNWCARRRASHRHMGSCTNRRRRRIAKYQRGQQHFISSKKGCAPRNVAGHTLKATEYGLTCGSRTQLRQR